MVRCDSIYIIKRLSYFECTLSLIWKGNEDVILTSFTKHTYFVELMINFDMHLVSGHFFL